MKIAVKHGVIGAALVLGGVLGSSWIRAANAAQDVLSAEESLASLVAEANEIVGLRAEDPKVSIVEHDPAAVLARVNTVLADAGISAEHFEKLAPESSTRASNGVLRRQSMRLSLRSIGLADLGQFLLLWKQREPLWTPSRIELTQRREDATLDVAIVLSTWVVGDEP